MATTVVTLHRIFKSWWESVDLKHSPHKRREFCNYVWWRLLTRFLAWSFCDIYKYQFTLIFTNLQISNYVVHLNLVKCDLSIILPQQTTAANQSQSQKRNNELRKGFSTRTTKKKIASSFRHHPPPQFGCKWLPFGEGKIRGVLTLYKRYCIIILGLHKIFVKSFRISLM